MVSLLLCIALSQVPTDDDVSALVRKGQALAALRLAESRLASARNDDERARRREGLATARIYAGDWWGAEQAVRTQFPERVKLPSRVPATDAVTTIVAASKGRRFVLLNENHALGQHRALATALLEALAREGFTYFAAEGFNATVVSSMDGGVPSVAASSLAPDPLYAELMRTAVRLGMTLVPYDDADGTPTDDWVAQVNERETLQATALAERTVKRDPHARVFVLAGFSHVHEVFEEDIGPMAARLKALTGLDPLTVDQTLIASSLEAPAPRVFTAADGGWAPFGEALVDVQVVHPTTRLRDGRPEWLFHTQQRKAVPLPASARPQAGRELVRAFLADEPSTQVPFDAVVVGPKTAVVLALKPGRYRLVRQREDGSEVDGGALLVKP